MYNYCKTCWHDDGDIGFCDKCYYNHILEEKGIPPTEYEAKPKPITNADRIRNMSDEELAEVIKHPCDIGNHIPTEWCASRSCGYQCSLDWLKQEAE